MAKDRSSLTATLNRENKALRQKLKKVSTSIVTAIKTGNIDALLVGAQHETRVYTEKTSDKAYRILIEKMHEGAIMLNDEGTVLYCNSFFAQMVRKPLQKVIGTKFRKYVDVSSWDQFDALIKNGWNAAGSQSEIAIHRGNSNAIPVLMSVNSLSLDKKAILSIIISDLTSRNRNQEELKLEKIKLEQTNSELVNANKDLTIFTYLSSHDLQEPLRKIQNFVKMIVDDKETKLSEPANVYFERCQAAANRMQALIEDLLSYSQAKNVDRKFETVDLNLVVDAVIRDYDEVIKEASAVIITHLGEASILRFQFGQVMQNLIANSLKFTKENTPPHIRIESEVIDGIALHDQQPELYNHLDEPAGQKNNLSTERNYCHITYTDNGIGFDPRYNERIFEVFQRLHSQDKFKGTGMGLAICKRIIENHQGVITASGHLDKGVRFDIYIPAKL